GRSHGGPRRRPTALRRRDERADRPLQARSWRGRHRLPPADHGPAARARADGVSVHEGARVLMAFLAPLFLAGGAAIALPIVLHLLKREPENRVRFSAVHLLKEAPVER